jgi:hypothetical protein
VPDVTATAFHHCCLCVRVRQRAGRIAGAARGRRDAAPADADRQRDARGVRLREQHLGRRARRRLARRLTSFQGATTNPKFSPEGKWIAFSADYGGNTDVYVVARKAASRSG